MQELLPPKIHGEGSRRCPELLSPWFLAMLSGTSSLIHLRLGMEMLPCLPISRGKILESLHIDTKDTMAVRDAMQAVMDYQRLRSLTIVFLSKGSTYRTWNWDIHLPNLDLQRLMHLRYCHLKYMPAPDGLFLSQSELELTTLPEYITGWSKLWHRVQANVHSITIERYPDSWLFSLHEWPEGIDAFHGLQFLQLNCGAVGRHWGAGREALDLAHIAYIPHVSLWCKSSVSLKISKGSWKVLEVFCRGFFSIPIDDATAFMEGTNTFSFTFNSALSGGIIGKKMVKLIKELKEAGAKTGKPLYEYYDMYKHHNMDSPLDSVHFNAGVSGDSFPIRFGKSR